MRNVQPRALSEPAGPTAVERRREPVVTGGIYAIQMNQTLRHRLGGAESLSLVRLRRERSGEAASAAGDTRRRLSFDTSPCIAVQRGLPGALLLLFLDDSVLGRLPLY